MDKSSNSKLLATLMNCINILGLLKYITKRIWKYFKDSFLMEIEMDSEFNMIWMEILFIKDNFIKTCIMVGELHQNIKDSM